MTAGVATLTVEWVGPEHRASSTPEQSERSVDSVEELDALLDELDRAARAAGYPHAVVVTHGRTRNNLSVVVGADWDFLVFINTNEPPNGWSSLGGRNGPQVGVFYFGGHWSEAEAAQLISPSEGRAAMREFVLTGERPDDVKWVQDC